MGEINSTQLKLLKDELIQLFHFQYSHNGHVLIDVRHIHQHPTLSESAMTILARIIRLDNYYFIHTLCKVSNAW